MIAKIALVVAGLALALSIATAINKRGPAGATGPRGLRGRRGASGASGATGAPGPAGPRGKAGSSALPPLYIGPSKTAMAVLTKAVDELCEQGLVDGYMPGASVDNGLTLHNFYCSNPP